MNYRIFLIALSYLFSVELVNGQSETFDDVHLFQTFFRDASVDEVTYGEAGFSFADFDGRDQLGLGVKSVFPVYPQVELGAALGFISSDPDVGNGESGISDLLLTGRYNFDAEKTRVSAGGFLTLPTGEENLGQNNVNFGAFGALRHPAADGLVVTGSVGLDFLEFGDNRETSLLLAGGVIYQTSDNLNLVGELDIMTEGEFGLLTGGVDYELNSGGRLRGALGLGLDDGAPDVTLLFSFLHFFK